MKIYIVKAYYAGYECNYEENIKAFFELENAEEYKLKVEIENLELTEHLQRLQETLRQDENRINTLNVTDSNRLRLLRESRSDFMAARDRILSDADDNMEYVVEDDGDVTIESLECGDFPEFFSNNDFKI